MPMNTLVIIYIRRLAVKNERFGGALWLGLKVDERAIRTIRNLYIENERVIYI